jgi:hypothetical protein
MPQADQCGSLSRLRSLEMFLAPLSGATSEQNMAADRHQVRIDLSLISLAAERSCTELGRYPASLRQLVRDIKQLPPSSVCVLLAPLDRDPWGRNYLYLMRDGIPHISSSGPDRRAGTADDISLEVTGEEVVRINGRETCRM